MTPGRFSRRSASPCPTAPRRRPRHEDFFPVMVVLSLLTHLLAALYFSHYSAAPHQTPKTSILSVDLVMAPVAHPQRGEAVIPRKTAPAPALSAPAPLPTGVTKEVILLKGKGEKMAPAAKDDDIADDIAQMRQRLQDKTDLNDAQSAIAALKGKKRPILQPARAIGTASASGDEAGSDIREWLGKAVKEKWSWPDQKRKDLSAEVEVAFDSTGKLCNYRITRTSGIELFDRSLLNALLKLEPLPRALCKPFEEKIIFNLKDLQRP